MSRFALAIDLPFCIYDIKKKIIYFLNLMLDTNKDHHNVTANVYT